MEWTEGYLAALRDALFMANSRGLQTPALEAMIDDLIRDAYVIEHEADNKQFRRKQKAAREAYVEPVVSSSRPILLRRISPRRGEMAE